MQYLDKEKFYLAVDCVIFGFDGEQLKLLLYKRDFEPERGKWSLIGGFLRKNENLNEAAIRVLARITGLRNVYLEQLDVFSEVDRDPVDQVVSVGYFALINILDYDEKMLKEYGAEWFAMGNLPEQVFDHDEFVKKALKRLKRKSKSQPIGFELLPTHFTLPDLKKLYEAIFQREIDAANLRRKFMTMGLLDKLPIKDKSSSRKGAYLYVFNQERYKDLMSKGFAFDVSNL